MASNEEPDLLIIGGGITGVAAARDAAGRGLSVVLLEKNDIASGTTSRSSRMAHGGLRYLEGGEIRLVRESLRERNLLFEKAGDLVRPARFRLPARGLERIKIGAGLGLYDLLAGSRGMRFERGGFSYVDGLCDPEKLTARMAADAAGRGAVIRTYCGVRSVGAEVETEVGDRMRPRAILLCAGPWTDRLLAQWNLGLDRPILSPTRGTHLLMNAPIERPYLLRASDGRVFFAIPAFEGTLVGTTDIDDVSDPGAVRPRDGEIEYLLREVKRYLPELGESYRGAWTGIRPLVASDQAAGQRSRGEMILRHPGLRHLVIVVGGKLTTTRLMAERAVATVEREIFRRMPAPWTKEAPLPEKEFPPRTLADAMLRRSYAAFGPSFVLPSASASEVENFYREAKESFGLKIIP